MLFCLGSKTRIGNDDFRLHPHEPLAICIREGNEYNLTNSYLCFQTIEYTNFVKNLQDAMDSARIRCHELLIDAERSIDT